ncbi:hypothetical protein RB195_003891 [Necator americanus]|uniref:7TM GPCR serpentine receptor class x (Srx) domain-containing protein n=1 Tax=Necator americanus TaxID=51031 RepID=A0ABR1DQR2_NECAM
MVTNTRITKMVSNRIVIQLNIADCIQLVLHFISGCLVLFPKIIEKDRVFVRIIGATINASWLVTFPILCLLAFARILIIFKYVSPLQMHFGLKIANTVAMLMGGCVLVLGIAGLHFTFTDLRWEYDIHAPFVNVVRNMELYAFTPCILLSYFAYAGVTLHIRAVRGMAQNSVLPRYETHIFLHYFVVCTFMIALVLTWNISVNSMNNTVTNVESTYLFSPNPDKEELIIGVIYSAIAVGSMPLYVVILYVMTTDKDITSNPQYRLMNQINFVDFGQAIMHTLSGIYVIFPQIQVKCEVLVRITGCTANSLWLAMFPIMSVLSISRILITREIMPAHVTPNALKILMLIGWLYTIGVWLWGCITQNFYLSGVGWTYDFTKLGATTLSALEWTIRKKVLQVLRGRTESTTKISVTTTNKQFSRR